MNQPLVVRGHYSGHRFIPDGPLPEAGGDCRTHYYTCCVIFYGFDCGCFRKSFSIADG